MAYSIRIVRNYGNLAFVPYTAVVYDRRGRIVRRFGRFSHNGALRRAQRWTDGRT